MQLIWSPDNTLFLNGAKGNCVDKTHKAHGDLIYSIMQSNIAPILQLRGVYTTGCLMSPRSNRDILDRLCQVA